MLETNNDQATKIAENPPGLAGAGGGFKGFNRTGREDTTSEILRPTVDPTTRLKQAALIIVVVVLLGIVGRMAFLRSGLTFAQPNPDQKAFAPGPQAE